MTDVRQEALKFFQSKLKRAQINLENAKKRGDTTAAGNIERKIKIYNYTISIIECERE